VVREAAKRVLNMRHFDVQLIGGMVLHDGKISEMRTGEGKTLVATLPAYLNALSGRGVHIVTVNDYSRAGTRSGWGRSTNSSAVGGRDFDPNAARRKTIGLRRRHHLWHQQRIRLRLPARQHGDAGGRPLPAQAELCDRGRSRLDPDRRGAHAAHYFRRAEDRTEIYQRMDKVAPMLKRQEKEGAPATSTSTRRNHTVLASEDGHEHAEKLLGRAGLLPEGRSLYEPAYVNLMHHSTRRSGRTTFSSETGTT